MTQARAVGRAGQVWGTFEGLRDHLFDQFEKTPFDPETGLSLEELEREVNAHLPAHPEQPQVLQKANVFRIAVTRGQICVDPVDWFAGKLDHGRLVEKLSLGWLDEATRGPDRRGGSGRWPSRAIPPGNTRWWR